MPVEAIIALAVCVLVFLVVAYFQGKSIQTVDDFFLASRQLRVRRFLGAYAGTNVTFTAVFLYLAAAGAKSGNIPIWATVFWILGVALFWWKYKAISSFCKSGHTLHEYLGNAFRSRAIRRLASAVTIVTFVAGVGLEFYGFAWLMEALTGKQAAWLVTSLVLLVIVIAYTSYGGFPATVATDLFQVILMVAGVGLLVYYSIIPNWNSETTARVFDLSHFVSDPLFILAYFVLFVPFQFSIMDGWQRCIAAGGAESVVRPSMLLGGVIVGLVFLVPVLIGILEGDEIGSQEANPLTALVLAVRNVPAGVGFAVVLCCFLSSLFSTADTLLLNAAYSLVYDQNIGRRDPQVSPREFGQSTRLVPSLRAWTALLGVASIVAYLLLLILPLSALILAILASQAVLGLLVLYHIFIGRQHSIRRELGARLAILTGFALPLPIVAVGHFAQQEDLIEGAPFLSVALAMIVFFAVPRRERAPYHDQPQVSNDVAKRHD